MSFSIGAAAALGGISAGSSLLGSYMSAKAAKKAQQTQINWERERAQNAHQWEVQDLIAAGLNPILSAGGQGANTGSISATMPDTSGYTSAGQAMQTAMQQSIEQQNAEANTTNAKTNQIVGESTSAKNYADAEEAAERTKYIGGKSTAEMAKNYADANEKNSQIAVNRANTGLIESQAELNSAKTISEYYERRKKLAQIKNIDQNTNFQFQLEKLTGKQKRLLKNNKWGFSLGNLTYSNSGR